MTHRRLRVFLGPWIVVSGLLIVATGAYAGGPLYVTRQTADTFHNDHQPIVWNTAAGPVQYRTPGAGNLGILSHDQAVGLVQSLFQVWEDVPTANIRYQRAGDMLPAGSYSGGAVTNARQFNDVDGSCTNGVQSPIIFDADGSLLRSLGLSSGVIGVTGICGGDWDGHIGGALVVLNGRYIDGDPSNGELTQGQFNQAFVHEFGHFSGLHHSQINVEIMNQPRDNCDPADVAGLPIMLPFAHCQARVDANNIPILSPDDMAWISQLYPETANNPPTQLPFSSRYTVISGTVLFSDGVSQVQGVNVIAHDVSDPKGKAVSVVSGYLFTQIPGQTVSTRNPASLFGSADAGFRGSFDIPVPAGTYSLEFESINPSFSGGSSVGPLSRPIAMPGSPPATATTPFTVVVGSPSTGHSVVLTGTPPRFDAFEAPE
jgi:hypothetical protein